MECRKKPQGFTLTEMVVTLAVGGLLMTVAVPSFKSLVDRNRVSTTINSLVSSLMYARGEAVRRGQFVSVCPSNIAATACETGESAATWDDGWLVYVSNDSGTLASSTDILKAHQIDGKSIVTVSSSTTKPFIYNASGFKEVDGITQHLLTVSFPDTKTGESRLLTAKSNGQLGVENK